MAIQAHAGRFTSPNVTGNQDVTGLGFQPEIVMLMVSTADTGNGASGIENTANVSMGVARSSGEQVSITAAIANGSTDADSIVATNRCLKLILGGASPSLRLDAAFSAMLSDGFQVNWLTVHGTIQYYVDYIALAGLGDSYIHVFTSPTSTGVQAETGVGFEPDAMILLGADQTAIGTDPSAKMIVGFADGTNDRCCTFAAEDGGGQARVMRDDACVYTVDDTQSERLKASLDSFDSDGFTLDWAAVDGANPRYLVAVCLRGVVARAGTGACRTTTGTQAYVVDVGHSTKVLFAAITGQGTENSIDTATARLGVGAAAGTALEFGRWLGRAGTASNNAWSDSALLQAWDEGDDGQDIDADVDSLDADGFTLDFSVVDGAARPFYYLSLDDVPPLPASGPMVGTSALAFTPQVINSASGPMVGTSDMVFGGLTLLPAAGPMVGTSALLFAPFVASGLLPVTLPRFRIALPWPITVGVDPVTELTCDLTRTAYREYGADMHVATYENAGEDATPGFTVAVALLGNVWSFADEGQPFRDALVRRLLAAVARYRATALAAAAKPDPDLPDPPGVSLPLSPAVAAYLDGGGGALPAPRGTFAAFRLLPAAEYATADAAVDRYRGSAP